MSYPMIKPDFRKMLFAVATFLSLRGDSKMKNATCMITLLLALGAIPALAAPLYYTIDSTILSTHDIYAPMTGSFDYDPTLTDSFTNFTVGWDGLTFDLTASANNPTLYAASTCIGGATGAAATFAFLNCGNGAAWYAAEDTTTGIGFVTLIGRDTPGGANTATIQAGPSLSDSNIADSGTFTIAQAVPEPRSYALMLIGLCVLTGKRYQTLIKT
jgi:hypothetical protein